MLHGRTGHEEGLIRPMKRAGDPDLGPDVLMVMIPSDLDYLLKGVSPGNVASFDQGFFRIHQVRREGRSPLTFCGPFLGAPQAVIGMEKAVALGARRVWVLSCCGSLQEDVKIGDLVVPTRAVSEEGTSRHYPIGPRQAAADEALTRLMGEALAGEGRTYRAGTVWTTDAPYRETPSKVIAYRRQGVLAVEMEMAALMTLSVFRAVKLAALLVVSDELASLKWHAGFKEARFKEGARFAADFLLALAQRGVDLESAIR